MNIGLILFISSLLQGAPSDNNSEDQQETGNINNNQTNTEIIVPAKTTELDENSTKVEKSKNSSVSNKKVKNQPTITGKASTTVNQDEFYNFIPFANDIDGGKLEFSIRNKPDWLFFDSRTGSLIGKPTNLDVGTNKEIIISVFDNQGGKASLDPFSIEVININDRPKISGIPSKIIEYGKVYEFIPKVKDIDIDIGKDTLIFSIKNKPKWALFNNLTGILTGNLNNKIRKDDQIIEEKKQTEKTEEPEEIIITVTDSHGESDSLKPFIIYIDHIPIDILPEVNKSATTNQISTDFWSLKVYGTTFNIRKDANQ